MVLTKSTFNTELGKVTFNFVTKEQSNNNFELERYAFKNKNNKGFLTLSFKDNIFQELFVRNVDSYNGISISSNTILNILNKVPSLSISEQKLSNSKILQLFSYLSVLFYNFSTSTIKTIVKNIFNKVLIKENESEIRFLNKFSQITSTVTDVMSIVSFVVYFIYLYKKYKNKKDYNKAVELDNKLNEFLFKNSNVNNSAFDMYSNIINLLKNSILNKNRRGLLLYGPPGTGKTFIVRKVLYDLNLKSGEDYMIIKGSAEDIGSIYNILYKNRNKLIIFDDFDSVLKNKDTVNLLKAACDTYPIRIVSLSRDVWHDSSGNAIGEAPDQFEFTGKIIIITNLLFYNLDNALISRLGACEVKFDGEQMIKIMEKMINNFNLDINIDEKKQVLNYLIYLKNKYNINLDLRDLKFALDCYQGFPNEWKEIIENVLRKKSNA